MCVGGGASCVCVGGGVGVVVGRVGVGGKGSMVVSFAWETTFAEGQALPYSKPGSRGVCWGGGRGARQSIAPVPNMYDKQPASVAKL